MNKKRHDWRVDFAVVCGAIAAVVGAAFISARMAVRRYDKLDHAAVLAACREMIANRQAYTNDPSYTDSPSYMREAIILSRDDGPYGPAIPKVIRDLNPSYIVIQDKHLIIGDPISFPPMRRGAIAFAADAELQFGTKPYIDGLWYWNSHFQTKEMRDRVYHRRK